MKGFEGSCEGGTEESTEDLASDRWGFGAQLCPFTICEALEKLPNISDLLFSHPINKGGNAYLRRC